MGTATGRELLSLDGHEGHVSPSSFSSDERIRKWEVSTGRGVPEVGVEAKAEPSLEFSPDGVIHLSDAAAGKGVVELRGHAGRVSFAAFSPDGRLLAAGTLKGDIRLIDMSTGKETGRFAGHRGPVSSLSFSPDGRRSGNGDTTILVWDVTSLPKGK